MTLPHALCHGKQGYASRTAVIHVLNRMRRAHRLRKGVKIYRCPWCQDYHYTSKPQRGHRAWR